MSVNVLYLSLLSIFSIILCTTSDTDITGVGATSSAEIIKKLAFSFRQILDDYTIDYVGINAQAGITQTEMMLVDYGITLDSVNRQTYPTLTSFPFLAEPFGFLYHLPKILPSPLNLTTDITVNIFLGNIRYWLDPQIVEINPGLPLWIANHTIDLVMRGGTSGTLELFCKFMASNSPEWNSMYPAGINYFPPDLAKRLNVTMTNGDNYGLFSPTYNYEYTLTFASIALYLSLSIQDFVQPANFQNKNGTFLSPNPDTVKITMNASTYDPISGVITQDTTHGGWPLTGYTFIVLCIQPNYTKCDNRRTLLKFVMWVFLSYSAMQSLEEDYYVSLDGQLKSATLDQISNLLCLDLVSLRNETISTHNDSARAILISTGILSLLILFTGLYLIITYEKTMIGVIFHVILTFGTVLNYASIVLWSLTPSMYLVCEARHWTMCMGMTLLLGAVFCRNLQLKAIHRLFSSTKIKKKINNYLILGFGMFIVVLVQIIISMSWSIMDPFVVTNQVVNNWDLTTLVICSSMQTLLWFGLEGIYFVILLLCGIYVVYSTWNIRNKVDDARVIAMAIYMCIMTIGVSCPLLGWLLTSDEAQFYWATTFLIINSCCLTVSVYLPKLIRMSRNRDIIIGKKEDLNRDMSQLGYTGSSS